MMRLGFLIYSTLLLLCSACTKDVSVPAPSASALPVVNCLFNPDSTWKVFVGKAVDITEKDSTVIIDNAEVKIFEEDQPFTLSYTHDGIYASERKPRAGKMYRIEVDIPGYPMVTASDRIPDTVSYAGATLDTIPTYFVPDNAFDNVKVYPLTLSLKPAPGGDQYYQLRAFSYNIDEYCDFIITDSTLKRLKAFGAPADYIDGVRGYLNIPIHGKSNLLRYMKQVLTGTGGGYSYSEEVAAFARKIRHSPVTHDSDRFTAAELYTKAGHLYNITGDSYAVFGEYHEFPSATEKVNLYTGDIFTQGWFDSNDFEATQEAELWLDIWSLSPALYRYRTTYTNQLINGQNPFSEPVQVYSNIKNGTGIFAGYRIRRIKIY